MNEAFSQSFTMKGVLYLMDGKTYRAVRKSSKNTAWEAVSVSGTAYVPTTTISAAPTGGGTSYEAVNLLTTQAHQLPLSGTARRPSSRWTRPTSTQQLSRLR